MGYYEKELKRQDKLGYADIYKKSTEQILEQMKNYLKDKVEVTYTDIDYGDTYFLFVKGTNSVNQFRIKECPGWLFGIWLRPVEKRDDLYASSTKEGFEEFKKNHIHVSLFTQYEDTIDKFKPSYSKYCVEFNYILNEEPFELEIMKFADIIEFIIKEPYLAFYRVYTGTDFNTKFVSREKAKREYLNYVKQKELEETLTKDYNKVFFDFLRNVLKEHSYDDAGKKGLEYFIEDRGENWSPRYEIIIKNKYDPSTFEDGVFRNGCYNIFDRKTNNQIYKEMNRLYKLANKKNVFWSDPINVCATILDTRHYNKLLKERTKENCVLFKSGDLVGVTNENKTSNI